MSINILPSDSRGFTNLYCNWYLPPVSHSVVAKLFYIIKIMLIFFGLLTLDGVSNQNDQQ